MKNFRFRLKALTRSLLLLPLFAFFPLSGQAATTASVGGGSLADVVKEIREMREGLMSWLSSAKELYLEYMFEANPSYPATLAANTSHPVIDNKVKELSQPDIKNALTQERADNHIRILSAIPASDSTVQSDAANTPTLFGKKEQKNKAAGDVNFDVNSLLSPLAYDTDEAKSAASRFIQFSSNIVEPLSAINISRLTPEQKKALDDSPVGRDYRVYLRSLVAARSIAMNNLLRMYAARLPVENLGKEAGIPGKEADASPLEVQEYKATRRTSTANWYESMSKAAPVTVERETLFVLAEIREQLYRMQQDNERIVLLLSIMELQNMQANKAFDKNKEEQARKLLGI